MSIEGRGLYQDDNGHDVRSQFRELIGEGRTPRDATRALLDRWADVLGDEDTYCAFYLARAHTQWRLGRPIQAGQDAALGIIYSGRDLKRWDSSQRFQAKRKRIPGHRGERLISA